MRNFFNHFRNLGKALRSRSVAATFLTFSMAFSILTVSVMTKAVYISDNESRETILKFTSKKNAEDILLQEGIYTDKFDVIDASGLEDKVAYINIKRAFPISISVDDQKYLVMVTDETVEDVLAENHIELGENDLINLPLHKTLTENDHISITRIRNDEYVENEIIPHKTIYKETSLIADGKTRTLNYGWDGKKQYIYHREFVNGEITSEDLIDETTLQYPMDTVVLVGKEGAPISDLDLGYTLDSNGIPTSYKKVLRNQVATGYSASKRAKGASGMRLFYGYVATDPAEIPYGTHMYITSPDGSFVYGYAIAADTGIGLLNDVIDVDLYYETYLESCLNGRRNVDIYILN